MDLNQLFINNIRIQSPHAFIRFNAIASFPVLYEIPTIRGASLFHMVLLLVTFTSYNFHLYNLDGATYVFAWLLLLALLTFCLNHFYHT